MRFYAFAEGHKYPLVKITELKKLNKIEYDSAIIDVGVYDLVCKYKDKPFPKERLEKTFEVLDSNELDKRWLVATADYPALPKEHGINIDYDNVKESLNNWYYYAKAKNWKQGIFTLQTQSITDYDQIISDYMKFPLQLNGEEIPYIGIGSLCRLVKNKKDEKELFRKLLQFVRERYPKSHIHVWGASKWHIEALYQYADSFDSTKWTRAPTSKLKKKYGKNCKNREQRKIFFDTYYEGIMTYKSQNKLDQYAEDRQ